MYGVISLNNVTKKLLCNIILNEIIYSFVYIAFSIITSKEYIHYFSKKIKPNFLKTDKKKWFKTTITSSSSLCISVVSININTNFKRRLERH